ncbi:MAG: hypothetical protein WBQ44_11435, partial [Rhodococcus sp. (in: high G+C Gram-positive bacteria)]
LLEDPPRSLPWDPVFRSSSILPTKPGSACRTKDRINRYSDSPAKPTGGSWMVHLTSAAIGEVPPEGGEWSKQIAIDIGSGQAGLTVTTDSPLNTTLLDPAGNTVRFTVA